MPMPQMTLDLPGMFLAAQNLRRQKEAQRFQEQQAALNYRLQQDQAAKLEQYRAAQMQQDQAALAQKQSESEADRAAKAASERAKAQDEASKRVANVQRFAAQALAANPGARDQVLSLLDAQSAMPAGLEQFIASNNDPRVIADRLQASASSYLGAPDTEKERAAEQARMSPLAQKLIEEGLTPGTNEWYARARELNSPSREASVIINNGTQGQNIPLANSVAADAQQAALDAQGVQRAVKDARDAVNAAGGAEKTQTTGHRVAEALGNVAVGIAPSLIPDHVKEELVKGQRKDAAITRLGIAVQKSLMGGARGLTSERAAELVSPYMPKEGDSATQLEGKFSNLEAIAKMDEQAAMDALTGGIRKGGSPSADKGIDPAIRAQIIADWRAKGWKRDPTEEEIAKVYQSVHGGHE